MALKVGSRGDEGPRPTRRPAAAGPDAYYPGEVAQILGCPAIDYAQLRRLYRLVRRQVPDQASTGWAIFTLRDVAAADVALGLAGGAEGLRQGKRLILQPIETACDGLIALGLQEPLLTVPMLRLGSVVYALVDGTVLLARSGQELLDMPLSPEASWTRAGGRQSLDLVRERAKEVRDERRRQAIYRLP